MSPAELTALCAREAAAQIVLRWVSSRDESGRLWLLKSDEDDVGCVFQSKRTKNIHVINNLFTMPHIKETSFKRAVERIQDTMRDLAPRKLNGATVTFVAPTNAPIAAERQEDQDGS